MQKWEYTSVWINSGGMRGGWFEVKTPQKTYRDQDIPEYLNILGQKGWELVTILQKGEMYWMMLFKRPIPGQ